ncbi:T7SS effector LXG polymorphic toxin [Terribacillus halophilus]|uniref:T7SS effector LXG polymorphic toxin n=1 Tax=Terribacillus halophilus TaxID=361279 RepID=UPI002118334A|nr:T7SS effector LXG polymorphic toxin [Terribacillus halophilus]
MKNLDVQDIQQQVDSTKKFINKTKEGVEQVKQAINGIATLNDGFKGKTADSIRSFYEEAHKPFLEFMESFLVQYEEALSSVTEEVRSFESNEQGFIREEFLQDDLKAKLVKASTSLTSTSIAINQQLLHVRDIANVSSVNSDPFIEAIDKGKERLSDTLSNMYDMDASATSKLDKPEDDIQKMRTYLAKLRSAIDKNNISVDSFHLTQFKGEFFAYHDEFKLLAKGRNALATGEKAEITEQDFNELYPYKKEEIYVSDGRYEWHGRYYTLEDGRIVREYKHDTGGVSYEFVDKIPDPRAAPDNWFSKSLKWTWDFFTEDIATIFDPEASAGEKFFALAMFLPIGKPVKVINKVGGGFISDGVKYLEDVISNYNKGPSVKKFDSIDSSNIKQGNKSVLAPGGGLASHEIKGGHLLERHIGKTDKELLDRVQNNPRIAGASTFQDRTTAEKVANKVLTNKENKDQIQEWLKNTNNNRNLVLTYEGTEVIGRGVRKGSTTVKDMTDARIVLKKSSDGEFILTGYPN